MQFSIHSTVKTRTDWSANLINHTSTLQFFCVSSRTAKLHWTLAILVIFSVETFSSARKVETFKCVKNVQSIRGSRNAWLNNLIPSSNLNNIESYNCSKTNWILATPALYVFHRNSSEMFRERCSFRANVAWLYLSRIGVESWASQDPRQGSDWSSTTATRKERNSRSQDVNSAQLIIEIGLGASRKESESIRLHGLHRWEKREEWEVGTSQTY